MTNQSANSTTLDISVLYRQFPNEYKILFVYKITINSTFYYTVCYVVDEDRQNMQINWSPRFDLKTNAKIWL